MSILKIRDENGNIIEIPVLKGDKGEDGKDAVTDQTYDPSSKNAQSGKAVAEAVGNIRLHDFAFEDSTAYIMELLKPFTPQGTPIRSIRLLGDGKTIARNSDLVDDKTYRAWNHGTKEDKINIEIGSGITEIREGAFRDLKPTINKVNFSNAKSNLVIGKNAFAYNDLNGEFELPNTFDIKKFAFIGNPCGIKWKSNYSSSVNEPILNNLEKHITQRNEEYKNISYSNSNVYKSGCILCQMLILLEDLTNAEVTIEELVLLARNNAFVVNKFTSNTITDVTVDNEKMLGLSLTGKEATDTKTSTVADRKYHNLKFTFTANTDGQTFTVEKYFRDTKKSETITDSLSVADLSSVYGISFGGSLTVGDSIIVAVYPYEATSGGTNTDFIKFVADKYNLSCTVLERPIDLKQHNEFLLSQLSKDVYIVDSTGGHNISIRGCNANGDVYVVDTEDKTLNQHTQDLQYVFAEKLPSTVDEFPLNTFKIMHKVHYKNLWIPITGKEEWTTAKGVTFRIVDGIFEVYGTPTSTLNTKLYNEAKDFTITPNKPYTMFGDVNHITVDTTKIDVLKTSDNLAVFAPKENVTSFNALNFKFNMTANKSLGTVDNPTTFKCMVVEGDYFERGLTFFPYEE